MEKETLIAPYRAIAKVLRCPLCGKRGRIASFGGFLCEKKHTFDLSAKGYLNFVPQVSQQRQKYDRGLFESRRRLFAAGFYQPVRSALLAQIQAHAPAREAPLLLDVGCGEGYYAMALRAALPTAWRVLGADISRDAIQLAAGQDAAVCWLVSDLKRLPLAGQSVDVLLNILTPADYREFCRVLQRDGLLLKIIPGPHYLREVRGALGLPEADPAQTPVAQHFIKHMRLLDRQRIQAEYPLSPEEAQDFLRMTPMAFDRETETPAAALPRRITIDLELLVGQRKH